VQYLGATITEECPGCQECERLLKAHDFLSQMLPLLLSRTVDKLEKEIDGVGHVTAYWAGTILRIDLKPKR